MQVKYADGIITIRDDDGWTWCWSLLSFPDADWRGMLRACVIGAGKEHCVNAVLAQAEEAVKGS